jgi:hypothetical protein
MAVFSSSLYVLSSSYTYPPSSLTQRTLVDDRTEYEYACIAITLTRAGDHHRHSWDARRVAPFALPQLTLLAVWDQAEPHEAHRLRRQHERPKPAPVVP